MITVGLPKDKPRISSFILSFCIYTMYIYTFSVIFLQKKAVPSDAALALPIPPKVQSRPAGHMQA